MIARHCAFCRPDSRSHADRAHRAAAGIHRSNPCDLCETQLPTGQTGLCTWCQTVEVDRPRDAEWWVA